MEILEKLMDSGGYSHLIVAGSPEITSQIQKILPKKHDVKLNQTSSTEDGYLNNSSGILFAKKYKEKKLQDDYLKQKPNLI